MLRVVAHKSAAAARQYYAEGLKREDYYSQGQEVAGKWFGKAAALIGLTGDVTPEAFAALVENRHPGTGAKLTPRVDKDRIVGYDINFHAPKSLSVLHALTGDQNLNKAFREAVAETMAEMEQQAATRVRKGSGSSDRVTGNLAWAEFVHFTARPVGGIPDPHLHVHAFVFNATFDGEENRWKAAKFHDIKKDAPYSEAVFHSLLTNKLATLGYGIERTRSGWEINGIPNSVIAKFSRRTAQIERLAAAKGIEDAKAKDALGAASRESKRKGLTQADLRAAWEVRLTPEEKAAITKVHAGRFTQGVGKPVTARQAFDYACEKLFEKNSVVEQKRLVAEAMRFGFGHVLPDAVWREAGSREMIVKRVGSETLCTSLDVLAEEVSLIHFVRGGRGMCASFVDQRYRFDGGKLSAEQLAAAEHILHSQDQVIAIRGAAGVGKTTMLRGVVDVIEQTGMKVFAFAPSAKASRETLREAGFANATTIAQLLVDTRLQNEVRGQVILIDEAGLLGVREMWQVMKLAGNSTRVILTGDAEQHAPVARGDAFRLLQKYAGLKVAELTEIRRQEVAGYKSAVAALSKGDLRAAFRKLDDLGAILEIEDAAERYRMLAEDYLHLGRKGSPPLVVSPTHGEGAAVTAAIRDAMRERGKLSGERQFVQFHNLQWGEADRRHADNYHSGLVVQFHQNAKGIKRGALFHVASHDEKGVRLKGSDGRETILPLESASRFQVFEEREITLGRGDLVRITRGGDSADGRRLNNGNVFTIEKFNRSGDMVLNNGAVLSKSHGHIASGFCMTSHSAQGSTVRDVLVAQSAASFSAGSTEQLYVSVSRGKETVRIYTDSRLGLQQATGNSSKRQAGVELTGITTRDISSMGAELNAKQWRDHIKSRRGEDMTAQHLQNLLRERKHQVTQKAGVTRWENFVKMKRSIAGPDGKSRSKGHPKVEGKAQPKQNRYRSFIRPTSLTAGTTEKMARANEAKKAQPSKPAEKKLGRLGRIEKALTASVQRFKERVGSKLKKPADGTPRKNKPLPSVGVKQAAKHNAKQRAQQAGKAQTKTQAKVQQAPPPTIRRGK